MVDILQTVLTFLNINCSIVNCFYPNPLEGLFYLVLLPTAFILFFLYGLFNFIASGHKGLDLLITVVVYIFIILNGWFTFFAAGGRLWIIILIIWGFIWVMLFRKRGGGREGGGGGMPALGKVINLARKKATSEILGTERDLEHRLKISIAKLTEVKKDMEESKKRNDYESLAKFSESYNYYLKDVWATYDALYEFYSPAERAINQGKLAKYRKQVEHVEGGKRYRKAA